MGLRLWDILKAPWGTVKYNQGIEVCLLGPLFLMYACIFNKKGRDSRREIFHLLVHFQNICNSQGWARLNLRAWNPTLVSHVCGRVTTRAITCYFLGYTLARSRTEVKPACVSFLTTVLPQAEAM